MKRALELAALGEGRTSPNPMVGAVVVDSCGNVVGTGWHRGPGEPHAEVVALDEAGERASGGTLYVTLEPCCHYGRTPPCVDRVIASGVKRVVAAMTDPNPLVSGKGFARLAAAGIQVEAGVMEKEARLLNRSFVTWMTLRRPYVTLKLAQSLDGKAATRTGQSQWITSAEARDHAHSLRARADAIVVGIGTALADDPLLTARPKNQQPPRQPARVVVDSRARLPLSARCLREPGGPTWVATSSHAPKEKVEALAAAGARVWVSPGDEGRVDLAALLEHLAAHEVTHLLVEGGPTLAGSFVDLDLVDEVHVYIAPLVIGGSGALSSVGGAGRPRLDEALALVDVGWERIGRDFHIYGRTPRPHLGD